MKPKDDDILNESNVEVFIMSAIKSYFDKNMVLDAMFWRSAIATLTKKYNINEQFNKELKKAEK